MKKEINRIVKLKEKTKRYTEFEKAVINRLSWYMGSGETRLKLNSKADIWKLWIILGGK